MIKKISYEKINFKKYSDCLNLAVQNSDYARKEFLDIVGSQQWEILVLGDYEAVMPVFFVKKFGIKIVLMPKLCQQLGIFSKENSVEINNQFLNFFRKNYNVFYYAFNKDNQFTDQLSQKTSYVLESDNYSEVKKKYSVHRRRNVRIIGELLTDLEIKEVEFTTSVKDFFFNNTKGMVKEQDRQSYYDLMRSLLEKKQGVAYLLKLKNEIQSLVFLYQTKNSNYLSLFVNKEGLINRNTPSIMIDQCLQRFIDHQKFDFMGSEVKSVADFNSRFGAIAYKYNVISQSKITLLKNLLINTF